VCIDLNLRLLIGVEFSLDVCEGLGSGEMLVCDLGYRDFCVHAVECVVLELVI
jgi:hypothetical protein